MNPWRRLAAFSMVCMLTACSSKDSDADSNPGSGSASGSGASNRGGAAQSPTGGGGGVSGRPGDGGSAGSDRGGASAGVGGAVGGAGDGGAAASAGGGASGEGDRVDARAMVEDMGFGARSDGSFSPELESVLDQLNRARLAHPSYASCIRSRSSERKYWRGAQPSSA